MSEIGKQGFIRPIRAAVPRVAALVVALLTMAGFLAGCRTSGLVFGKGQLRIVSPGSSSTVTLPMTITWTAGGVFRAGDSFAVFLDREPIGPDRDVLDLVPDSCKQIPACSSESYLEQAKAWVTSSPSLVLTTLPRTSLTGHSAGKEYHTLTVVVLDSSRVRTSEEFASVDFVYLRQAA